MISPANLEALYPSSSADETLILTSLSEDGKNHTAYAYNVHWPKDGSDRDHDPLNASQASVASSKDNAAIESPPDTFQQGQGHTPLPTVPDQSSQGGNISADWTLLARSKGNAHATTVSALVGLLEDTEDKVSELLERILVKV